jgi:hypothetical protein
MATAISFHAARRVECAFYEIDPRTGATIDIFCADCERARPFGTRGRGWYWRERGSPNVPNGPFMTSLNAYRAAMGLANRSQT